MPGSDEANSEEPIRQMTGPEFVRRFKRDIHECEDSRFVFFIGAGCSISSGIPGAKDLVKTWLQKLKYLRTGDENNCEEWAKQEFKGYSEDIASQFYGKVIKELFLNSETRQQEIERLTGGKDPGFGYAVLASLMALKDYGGHCNVALTVNFDDMIADALYLYTNKKPLVIVHDSLVGFVRSTRKRPMILKLHGDARLDPKNTEGETHELADRVKKVLKSLLAESGLIFIGYGGHDESIIDILNDLPRDALPWGIYWISNELPEAPIKKWLIDRSANWVKHLDFDELMLLIRNEFNLSHPDDARFTRLTETYRNTFDRLQKQVGSKPQDATSKALSESLSKALDEAGTSWWGALMQAQKFEESDPDVSERLYLYAAENFPNLTTLAYYAKFLRDFRKDYDKAEYYHKKNVGLNPNNATALATYGNFLMTIRKDYDEAENYYKKSLALDPDNPIGLTNYPILLWQTQRDYGKAEEYFEKYLKLNPSFANNLGNYAGFLLAKGDKKGFDLWQKAMDLIRDKDQPMEFGVQPSTLILEMQFYKFAHSADKESRKTSLSQIRSLLKDGIRSVGWNLSSNVQKAIEDGHACPEFLSQLAKVISEEEDITRLDRFDVWTKEEGC